MFMKQKLMLFSLMFVLLLSACRKDMLTEPVNVAEDAAGKPGAEARFGQCRLTSAIRDNAYGEFLQYNNRGLVSEWKEDYFDGFPYVVTYTYDLLGRLKTGHVEDTYSGISSDVKYQYSGSRLIKHTIYETGTNTVKNVIVNTYNNRGQIIRRGSTMFPVYCTFSYDWLGNNNLVNYYVDGALYMKEEFTHRQFNRNPFLAAHGIPYVTYAYDFVFSNWWETSEKFTLYDNGVANVFVDLDPQTAVLTLGPQQYLTSVTNFDRAIQENTSAYFNYENCDCVPAKIANGNKVPVNSIAAKYLALAKFKRAFEAGDVSKIKAQMKAIIQK